MNFKLTLVLASVFSSVFLLGCNSGSSADRVGTVLGNINQMKSVYVVNQSNMDETRSVLGTPNYKTALQNGNSLYVYTFKVNYPFEGLSSFGFMNNMKEKPNATNKDKFKTLPSTSKILAIETDDKGLIKSDYTFGFKYIFSRHIEGSNDTYCLTELSPQELEKKVNFSQHEIESVYNGKDAATTYMDALKSKLSGHYGEIKSLDKVQTAENDGRDIKKRPSILFGTYCNEITCNKEFKEF